MAGRLLADERSDRLFHGHEGRVVELAPVLADLAELDEVGELRRERLRNAGGRGVGERDDGDVGRRQDDDVGARPELEGARVAELHPRPRRGSDVEPEPVEARPHRGLAGGARHDLRGDRGQQRLGIDDLLALVAPVGQHHRQPLREVVDRAADAARGRFGLRVADVVRVVAAVDVDVPDRAVRPRHVVVEPGTGRRHAERPVQHVLAEVLPRPARRDGDRLGTRGQTEVGVRVRDTERIQRKRTQVVQHVAPVIAQVLEQIARVIRQAGPVRVHVADRHHLGHRGVRQREPRQLVDDRGVPADRVHPHLMRDHRGSERFGQRGQLEHGVGVDPILGAVTVADVLDAESLRVHGFSAVHHGDGHAGDARLRHQILERGRRACPPHSRRRCPATASQAPTAVARRMPKGGSTVRPTVRPVATTKSRSRRAGPVRPAKRSADETSASGAHQHASRSWAPPWV